MTKANKNLGKWGERQAAQYLIRAGIEIIEHNYYTPHGEIDLIGREEQQLIFFEVKTRTGSAFGNPEEAVTPKKKQHLINSALFYLQEHCENEPDWRIDVIAIKRKANQELEILWFKNAIEY
ncbi:MAG TPA: YraN family protein [Anaerolineae bacterium]|nr:YraN family protein [Anaerolineae bacterium]